MKCHGGNTPEAWFFKYHVDNTLYSLYVADQDAFAFDHREVGVHNKVNAPSRFQTISMWKTRWDVENLPDYPVMFDYMLKDDSIYAGYEARKLWDKGVKLLILRYVYDEDDFKTVLDNKQMLFNQGLSQTLFVTSTSDLKMKLINLGLPEEHVGVHRSRENVLNIREEFIVENLKFFSRYYHHKMVLPLNKSLILPEESVTSDIIAGREQGQKHPRIDWLFLRGSLGSYAAMHNLLKDMRSGDIDKSLQHNFLAKYCNPNNMLKDQDLTWSWM